MIIEIFNLKEITIEYCAEWDKAGMEEGEGGGGGGDLVGDCHILRALA